MEYELDETLFETSMPNFLLQPIVENAIEHGMNYQEEIEGRGRLIVRLEEEDGHLIFSILNNGPRVELDRLEEILNTPAEAMEFIILKSGSGFTTVRAAVSTPLSRQTVIPVLRCGLEKN